MCRRRVQAAGSSHQRAYHRAQPCPQDANASGHTDIAKVTSASGHADVAAKVTSASSNGSASASDHADCAAGRITDTTHK